MESTLRVLSIKKDYVNRNDRNRIKYDEPLIDFVEQIATQRTRRITDNTRKSYLTLLLHLKRFSDQYDAILYVESVNEFFMDDFINYLEDNNYKASYVKTLISLLKATIKRASNMGYAVDSSYNDVTIEESEPFSIYLSMNDIVRIYYFKGLTRYQERVRDMFVLGCLTALRYSDYSTLQKGDFADGLITKVTQKTKKKVIIPMHDFVKELYDKYDGEICKPYSIQYFDRAVKKICKTIGFNDDVTFTIIRGGKEQFVTKKRHELIGSHTARRSAATNLYLTGRFKTYEIMSITGHETEKSFFRYIKVTREDIASQIKNDNFFKK